MFSNECSVFKNKTQLQYYKKVLELLNNWSNFNDFYFLLYLYSFFF